MRGATTLALCGCKALPDHQSAIGGLGIGIHLADKPSIYVGRGGKTEGVNGCFYLWQGSERCKVDFIASTMDIRRKETHLTLTLIASTMDIRRRKHSMNLVKYSLQCFECRGVDKVDDAYLDRL